MAPNKKSQVSSGGDEAAIGGKVFVIPGIRPRRMLVRIVGQSALLMNNGARKIELFRDIPEGEVTPKKQKATMAQLYEQSFYADVTGNTKGRNAEGREGYLFPAVAFKVALVNACRFTEGLQMTMMRGAAFVSGTNEADPGFVLIDGKPEKFDHVGRTSTGSPCPNSRAKFTTWSTDIILSFSDQLRDADVMNLLNLAGFHCGVGDWRPMSKTSSSGQFGRFMVAGTPASTQEARATA